MPWNSTTEKIVGAANINNDGDIQKATGQDYQDIGNCIKFGCQSGGVNKWSKVKPIHYPGKFKLSLEEFRGTPDMVVDGIVYGLSVPAGYQTPVPSLIHATTWDYVGYPNASGMSGISPYRITDFINPNTTPASQSLVGYSKNAKPDIHGDIPSSSIFYINASQEESSGLSIVNALYEPNNSEGVAIAEYVVSTSPGEAIPSGDFIARMSGCYPGILIGNYITALSHGDTDAARPLRYNDAWTSDNWYVDMSKVLGKTTTPGGTQGQSPWSSTTPATASLVLIYPVEGTTYLLPNDSGTDIAQYWVYIPDSGPAAGDGWNSEFFPIPMATGKTILLSKRMTETVANVDQIVKTASGFEVSYSFTEAFNEAFYVILTTELYQGSTRIGSLNRRGDFLAVTSGESHFESFNWMSDFDIGVMPDDVYEVKTTIFTYIGQAETQGNGLDKEIII